LNELAQIGEVAGALNLGGTWAPLEAAAIAFAVVAPFVFPWRGLRTRRRARRAVHGPVAARVTAAPPVARALRLPQDRTPLSPAEDKAFDEIADRLKSDWRKRMAEARAFDEDEEVG